MKIKRVSVYKLMPNFITVMGLCLGISALRYALDEKFVIACVLILTAALSDSLDGRMARFLKCESDFGAQLDSLADIISFGVAPAIILYLWSLQYIPYVGVGWSIVLFYITCGALRLARFNSELTNPEALLRAKLFFTGIPITAAACLCLLPMIITFKMFPHLTYSPWWVAIYCVALGLLMISRVPTFSGKSMVIPVHWLPYVRWVLGLVCVALILEPWWMLPILGMVYFLLIPFSIYFSFRYKI